jgi:uracil-DNA glycosylase family 4
LGNSINQRKAAEFDAKIVACSVCPRLVAYREEVAQTRRRAYIDQEYWGKPVPSFGPIDACLLILGLAPGAHGANRTGRVFTGDSSGDLLYRVLYKTGFATQPESRDRLDGLRLLNARISCSVRCVPPDNKPSTTEILNCRRWLEEELGLMKNISVVVALGGLAFNNYLRIKAKRNLVFGHGIVHDLGPGNPVLISSYHPSQQNTFTGKLTEEMLLDVFAKSRSIIETA